MLVSVDNIKSGIVDWFNSDLLPRMPTTNSFVKFGYSIGLASVNVNKLIPSQMLNLFSDENGLIDIDVIYNNCTKYMNENKDPLTIPVISYTLDLEDIKKIYEHIQKYAPVQS